MTMTTTTKQETKKQKAVFQTDNKRGWLWMCLYWTTGLIVGLKLGHLASLLRPHSVVLSVPHSLATVLTVAVQPRLLSRFGSYGRQANILAVLVFAVCNGIFETMLFLASFDLGREYFNGRFMAGFMTFSIYSALIHVFFWLPHGFPRHVLVDAPPFLQQGLPELTLMSLSWMYLYVLSKDVLYVCLLHMLVNILVAIRIGLEWPLSTKRK